MILYLNGKFVPEEQAVISAFDRGFLYGDGLFETLRISNGRAFMWEAHVARLERGADALHIIPPESPSGLAQIMDRLLGMNRLRECLLRVTLSRGPGVRGYSPRGANAPTLMISLHPLPDSPETLRQWRLTVSSHRTSDPLAQFKTSNKLVQVLAREEADHAGADDAIVLHPDGTISETSGSNVFWLKSGMVHTGAANGTLLPGITRQVVLDLCRERALPIVERPGTLGELRDADGVFLTQTTLGIVEAVLLDDAGLKRSEFLPKLHQAYHEMLRAHTR